MATLMACIFWPPTPRWPPIPSIPPLSPLGPLGPLWGPRGTVCPYVTPPTTVETFLCKTKNIYITINKALKRTAASYNVNLKYCGDILSRGTLSKGFPSIFKNHHYFYRLKHPKNNSRCIFRVWLRPPPPPPPPPPNRLSQNFQWPCLVNTMNITVCMGCWIQWPLNS